MEIFAETERLILRAIEPEDEAGMFELDSDPEVHRYVGNKPVQNPEQIRMVIAFIRQQYVDNGIGRWAVIEKSSGRFIGWAGLKLITDEVNGHNNFHDLGYRFIKAYWGKGYATEAAQALVDYGFNEMGLTEIYAMTDVNNAASINVLKKAGLSFIEIFDFENEPSTWFKIEKK